MAKTSHLALIAVIMVGHDINTISRIANDVTGINGTITWSGPGKGLREPGVLETIFGVQAVSIDATREILG